MSSSQSYTINGVKVLFPCKAYPSQLSMMDKIIKGIDRQQNCLLESPTGSGKSLALLCSALAWQTAQREKLREEDEKSAACCCHCHGAGNSGLKTGVADGAVYPGSKEETILVADDDLSGCSPTSEFEKTNFITINSDSDDDFQSNKKKSRTATKQVVKIAAKEKIDSSECKKEEETKNDVKNCDCNCEKTAKAKHRLPKIYFGTRTHKQVAQIVRELGKTAYSRTRMTILSSREHTCIHPEVTRSSSRNEECKNLLEGNGCRFYDRAKRVFIHPCLENSGLDSAWDIEDIVTFAKKKKACSYFGARQLRDTADVIFCPYNYLIDPTIRKSMEISLNGQIVLLDEAHNIEDSSRESASYSVMQDQLVEAVRDLSYVAEHGQKQKEHQALAKMCEDLERMIETQTRHFNEGSCDGSSKVWTGPDIVAQLEMAGITSERLRELEGFLSIVAEQEEEKRSHSVEMKMAAATTALLDGLFMVLGFIYKENMKFIDDYRVAIVKMYTYKKVPTDNRWLGKRRGKMQATWSFQLNFWCMNPAVAFTDMSSKTRCIILSSGTLSPMTSFQSELGVVFPIQLEANHVIGNSQVWIASLSRGPDNQSLLGNYQNSETFGYQDEIGKIILQICQIVPFGVLCFLPSYKSMEKMMTRWQDVGILTDISKYKVILSEPRGADKENFDDVLRDFYVAVRNGHSGGEQVRGTTGALLLAVCRGKVSEGLDFADNNARAVITVGIPYPNFFDTQVMEKKKYNDARSRTKGLLSGSDWYEIQAYRALNQALGRCIRHRHDWGALILLDERFGKNRQKYTSGLSKWVRQKFQFYGDFLDAMNRLKEFTHGRLSTNAVDETSFVATQAIGASLVPVEKTVLEYDPDKTVLMSPPPELHDNSFVGRYCSEILTSTPVVSRSAVATKLFPVDQQTTSEAALSLSTQYIPITNSVNNRIPAFCQRISRNENSTVNLQHPVVAPSVVDVLDNESANVCNSRFFRNSQAGGFLTESDFFSPVAENRGTSLSKKSLEPVCFSNAEALTKSAWGDATQLQNTTNDHILRTNHQILNGALEKPTDEERLYLQASIRNTLSSANYSVARSPPVVEAAINLVEKKSKNDADNEVSSLLSQNLVKTNALDASSIRSESPDLFDSAPTEIGSEAFGAVLKELGADGIGICSKVESLEIESKSVKNEDFHLTIKPEFQDFDMAIKPEFQDFAMTKKPEPDASVPTASFLEMGQTGDVKLEPDDAGSDDGSEFLCSQVGKRRCSDGERRLSLRKKKKCVTSCETENGVSRQHDSANLDLNISPCNLKAKPESRLIEECRTTANAGPRKSCRMRRKKTFFDDATTSNATPKKGVDFLDELDSEKNHEFGRISCPSCNSSLTSEGRVSLTNITRETAFQPSFWKEFFQISRQPLLSLDRHHLGNGAVCFTVDKMSDVCTKLNSYWSETDRCCIQLLFCSSCAAARRSTCLGAEVKAVSEGHGIRLRPGQVWLVPECLKNAS